MMKLPCASVTACAGTVVPMFFAVTVAPGTTASELSRTVPVSDARSTCAAAGRPFKTTAAKIMARMQTRRWRDGMGLLQDDGERKESCRRGRNVKRTLWQLHAHSAFELGAVPRTERGGGVVGRLKKFEQHRNRRRRLSHVVVPQEELAELGVVERG